MHVNLSKLQEALEDMEAWRVAVHGDGKELATTEQLYNRHSIISLLIAKYMF